MMNNAFSNFASNLHIIGDALNSIEKPTYDALLNDFLKTVQNGNQIILSGIGKNRFICEKVVSTLHSFGLKAAFLHPAEAMHGEIGLLKPGDLLLLVSKSGTTMECVSFVSSIIDRKLQLWLLTFSEDAVLRRIIPNTILIRMQDEGDLWNVVPNNSTVISLMVLQTLVIDLARKLNLSQDVDYLQNHPGGTVGNMH